MTCLNCSENIKGNRRFCNRDCYDKYIANNGSINEYDKEQNQRICINCFKPFQFNSSLPKKRHCSRECFLELKKRNGYKEKICLNCGEIFIVFHSNPKQFCNQKCYHKYRKENFDEYFKPKNVKFNLKKSRDIVNNLVDFIGDKTFSPDVKPKPDVVTFYYGYMIAIEVEKTKGNWKLERRFNTYLDNKHNFDLVIVMSRDSRKIIIKNYSDIDSSLIDEFKIKLNSFYDVMLND